MIEWLEKSLVLAVHGRQLAEHGGADGIRDSNLLESSLARPQQLMAYSEAAPEVCQLAACLTFGLARTLPFIDANKRTAIICCGVFMALNNTELTATDVEIYPIILSLAEGHLTEEEFASWLSEHSKSTADQLQEKSATYASD